MIREFPPLAHKLVSLPLFNDRLETDIRFAGSGELDMPLTRPGPGEHCRRQQDGRKYRESHQPFSLKLP